MNLKLTPLMCGRNIWGPINDARIRFGFEFEFPLSVSVVLRRDSAAKKNQGMLVHEPLIEQG